MYIYIYICTCLEANLDHVVHSWLSMFLAHREYMGAYTTVPCHRELMSTSGSNEITEAAINVYSLEA